MSDRPGEIEAIARAVYVSDGNVLLCHSKGAAHTFLPGGHVEFGESTEVALCREIDEELGVSSVVVGYLGTVEHAFEQRSRRHHELNLVFQVDIEGLDPSVPPVSVEPQIDFRWAPLSDLGSASLEPAVLQELIPRWLAEPRRWVAHWASSVRA